MTRIPNETCINTEEALRREWLETNGLGGYASSTVINCHTRKYHGFLVAALKNPRGRFVLLSKVEASLLTERKEFRLSTNKFPGVFHPTGHRYIESFEQDLFPVITCRVGDILLRESFLMPHEKNTILATYELLESGSPVTLRLRPLLAYRHIHGLSSENLCIHVKTFPETNGFKIQPYDGMPPLYLTTNRKARFFPGPEWIRNMEFLKERRRGYPYQEDVFCPGTFEIELDKQTELILGASVDPLKPTSLKRQRNHEIKRRKDNLNRFSDADPRDRFLTYSASQFCIRNATDDPSIVAGYHWFGEWGRDTMIALPGLTFYSGRMQDGLDILNTYAARERNGLLPNMISESDSRDAYNSQDAALWFFWALQEYLRRGGDSRKVTTHFLPTMENIIRCRLQGSVRQCRVLENGLLEIGDPDSQLTWMDANSNGKPVTPRHGSPVEINALWFNALCFFWDLCAQAGKTCTGVNQTIEKISENFERLYWNPQSGCLADVVRGTEQDPAVRPNQIFAVSLPFSPLSPGIRKSVIDRVASDLLTPYGLRTLSPAHPDYNAVYEGDQERRDAAYHQGTVWPWLAGHFGEAFLKVSGDPESGRNFIRERLAPLLDDFPDDFGIHCIPEIYNGDPPHKPKGCISQAWSLAEVIRLRSFLKGDIPCVS